VTDPLPLDGDGLYDAIPDATYHASPALSVSGAKRLLPPSCPSRYRWERDHPVQKDVFDFGKAAHAQVLGTGAEIVVVDADTWQTKAAKEAKAAAYAEGKTPLLAKDKACVDGMAAALRAHPVASALFDPDTGAPEQSGVWFDTTHGVWRRMRLDWLPDTDGGRLLVPDYKSCASAEPGAIAKAVATYHYEMQDAWYTDGLHALGIADDIAFLFVFQEKTPPYLITIAQLDLEAVRIGRVLNDRALQVFAECEATDTWPTYTDDVTTISLPGWATYQMQEITA